MTHEEFRLLRDFIDAYCGIFIADSMKFLLERRLRPRLAALGHDSFRDYYRLIRYGRNRAAELEQIVEVITTNETYFFRERLQLKAFAEEIIPALLKDRDPRNTVRIWSAGCSTGEEPYTVAMLLDEVPAARGFSFEIFGSDLSRNAIRVARAGRYAGASFRETDARYLERYFEPEGKAYRLREDVRKQVTFGHLNLMDDAALMLIANVDVIFCRNVMIYFARPGRIKLLSQYFRKLREGGYLLLGHSESLINLSTDFEIVTLKNDIVYRKPVVAPDWMVSDSRKATKT